jgi:hypothetical protein
MSNEPCNEFCAPCAGAEASPPALPSHSAVAGASPPISPSHSAGAGGSPLVSTSQRSKSLSNLIWYNGILLELILQSQLPIPSIANEPPYCNLFDEGEEFEGDEREELEGEEWGVNMQTCHAYMRALGRMSPLGADGDDSRPDGDDSRPDVRGENNHPAFSAEALGYPLLALFDKIVRGLKVDSLNALIDSVLDDARASSDVEMVKDLFVMAFQTRWCRGGKAEKLLFYKFIVHLYERFPNVVLDLMHLIPKYGYWKDLLSLLLECPTRGSDEMHAKVWSLFADQLGSDLLELETALEEGRTPEISLCAKYAPSEGGQHSKALRADMEIGKIMFHGAVDVSGHHVRAKYRRMLSRLRTQLHLTETLMCAQRWNEIDVSKVPSLCMDRQKYAFLNQTRRGQPRHLDDPERQAFREKFVELLKNGVLLKGKQLFPHELVEQVCLLCNCITCTTARCCS